MNTVHTGELLHTRPNRGEPTRLSASDLRDLLHNPDSWVTDTAAEQVIGICRASLRRLRHERRGPRYVKHAGSIRYKVAWLLEYLNARTVETVDSAKPPEAA